MWIIKNFICFFSFILYKKLRIKYLEKGKRNRGEEREWEKDRERRD